VTRCDARIVGEVIRELGGGRLRKDSVLNYDVGLDQLRRPGELVNRGSTLARVHAASAVQAAAALERLRTAFQISAVEPTVSPLVAEIIEANN
jgi:thymidine phosphorylase